MNKVDRLKVLKPFLQDYFTKDLEKKLSLEKTKGIPNCNFRYEKDMWGSEDDFWNFLNYARTSTNLTSALSNVGNALSYYIVLVEYKGIYYIQVEVEDIHGDILTRVYASDIYKECLEFALNLIGIKE